MRLYIPDSRPDKNFVRLLVKEQEKLNRDFTVYELLILNLLKTYHRMSQKEIASAAGIPSYKLANTLESLVESGLMEAIGQGKSRGYFLSAHLYQKQKNTIGYVRQTDIDTVRYPELILKLAQKQGVVRRADVINLLHVSPAQAYHLLDKLKKDNKLILEGKGKYAHYKPIN